MCTWWFVAKLSLFNFSQKTIKPIHKERTEDWNLIRCQALQFVKVRQTSVLSYVCVNNSSALTDRTKIKDDPENQWIDHHYRLFSPSSRGWLIKLLTPIVEPHIFCWCGYGRLCFQLNPIKWPFDHRTLEQKLCLDWRPAKLKLSHNKRNAL